MAMSEAAERDGRTLEIAGRRIADDTPAYLIAEIGHNHGGSLEKALQMVDTAAAAGANAVKFQTRVPKEVYAPGSQPGAYGFRKSDPQWMDEVYGVHREKLEFDHGQWEELFARCRERGITAFSTPFDFKSVDLLVKLGVPAIKIASGDATNIPMIEYAARAGVPLIISTGGCDIAEVDMAAEAVSRAGTPFALLQCSCIYPAPDDVMSLRVIKTYRSRYPGAVTGLSTHNVSWAPTLAAFALGGRIFEHHYTNDRSWKGTDNHFSLTPDSLAELRAACDSVLPALGDGVKRQDPRERSYTIERRKALYWRRAMAAGETITPADLIPLCPGQGIPPYAMTRLTGRKLARPVSELERVEWADVV
jgi:N-acetylneuraminate synthase/sialic acid synthase